MRKIFLIIGLILTSFLANSQGTVRYLGTPTELITVRGSMKVDSVFAIPSDTLMRSGWDSTKRWISAKGDSLYLWSLYSDRYVLAGGSGGGGGGDVTQAALDDSTGNIRTYFKSAYTSLNQVNDTMFTFTDFFGVADTVTISLANGDKGDIDVAAGWNQWTVDTGVINFIKLADEVTDTINARQNKILWQDEASDLGVAGSVDTVNITGAGATATISNSKLTIDVTSGSSTGDTIQAVASQASATGNIYLNTTDKRIWYKTTDYWYRVAVDDSVSTGASYDTDAQAYFTYIETTLGESLTTNEKTYVNDWFLGIKAETGLYAKVIAAHFILGGANGRKVNAVAPSVATYRIVTNVGCVLDNTGITTDGVDDWFEMGLVDGTALPLADYSLSFYNGINRAATDSKYAFGSNSGSGGNYMNIRDASDDINGRWQNSGDLNFGTSAGTNNHYLFNHRITTPGSLNVRRTTVGASLVYNSSYNPAVAVPSASGVKMAFGAFYNDASGAAILFDNCRFAIIVVTNSALTDAEETVMRTENTAFTTSMSRN